MVITVNGSCGLTATTGFNHTISSVGLTNGLINNRSTAFSQLPNQTVNSNQHLHANHSNYHPYLSNSTSTGYGHHRTLNDELNVLTNMYQPTVQHINNSTSNQLDLVQNSVQSTENTNQTLDHNNLDHLHSIHSNNSSFTLNNLTHSSQSHLLDQSTLHFNDNHDSTLNPLNTPELSYDLSRLINSRSKRVNKCSNDDSKQKSSQISQHSVFEPMSINQATKKLLKNDTSKRGTNELQQLNDHRTNQSPSSNCLSGNPQRIHLMNNFLSNNVNSNSSPTSELFNQSNSVNNSAVSRLTNSSNTGLLSGTHNGQVDSGLMNDKNAPISSLINSASSLANSSNNNLNSSLQSAYTQQSSGLKLHIKTEPDEQQQRDFTASACTSDNNSIYSPGALSESTELTGYSHSPHNLFAHVLSNDKEHDTHTDHLSNSITGTSSNAANLASLSSAAVAGSISNASMHSAASSLMDSMTGGNSGMNTNRFFNQCSNLNAPNSHHSSKLLLKSSSANSMSISLSNGTLQHHHSSNVLGNSNGTINMLGGMMSNSSNTSGLLGHNGPLSAGSLSGSSSVSSALNGSGKKHNMDKHSDEYKRRRERNNIAVRKSREKAKQRSRETEKKVNELYSENDSLKQKLSLMSKECRVLRQLLANYGVLPEVIERELASILKSDELQQQLLQQQTAAQHQQGHQLQQLHQQTNSAAIHQSVAHQHLQQLQQQTNLFQLHPAAHFSHNQSQHLSHY